MKCETLSSTALAADYPYWSLRRWMSENAARLMVVKRARALKCAAFTHILEARQKWTHSCCTCLNRHKMPTAVIESLKTLALQRVSRGPRGGTLTALQAVGPGHLPPLPPPSPHGRTHNLHHQTPPCARDRRPRARRGAPGVTRDVRTSQTRRVKKQADRRRCNF